jgi:golgi-specific brefeldin A-resistance guanine nucleotide exchange factor 1
MQLILPQQSIYDSIKKREIIMPEEHTGQLGFEYAWKELLARSRQTGKKLLILFHFFSLLNKLLYYFQASS